MESGVMLVPVAKPFDHGRDFDWGRTSADYASYRPGYPASFFERITALGVALAGQRVLDLGTGTGALARALAKRGCRVTGVDVSEQQISASVASVCHLSD